VLVHLEGECIKALQSIKRGLALLDDRQRPEDGASPASVPTMTVEGEPTRAQL